MTVPPLGAVSLPVLVPLLVALITAVSTAYLQAWRFNREENDQAGQVLRHYRDPLLRGAFDLQSRLYNIAARGFLTRYWTQGNEEQRRYARLSTLWLFGQYLGWVEILRREVQYLDLGSRSANETLQRRLNQVSAAIASDSRGHNDRFIVFRSDQRAIGEFMVISRPDQADGRPDCLGYSEFAKKLANLEETPAGAGRSVIVAWAERFSADLESFAESTAEGELPARLVGIQRCLIDLIDLLDENRVRYPHLDYRGKLPAARGHGGDSERVAYFIWPWEEPSQTVRAWASERGMKAVETIAAKHVYHGRRGPLVKRLELTVTLDDSWVEIEAGTRRFRDLRAIDGSLRCRPARRKVNDLLVRFDRPQLHGGATLPDRVLGWVFKQWQRLRVTAGGRGS